MGRGAPGALRRGAPVALARVAPHNHGLHCAIGAGWAACPVAAAVDQLWTALDDPWQAVPVGGRVVVKPNFVADRDREHVLSDAELAATCTDTVLLELVLRRAWQALGQRGELLVVDSPIEGTDIQATLDRLGVNHCLARLRAEGISVAFRDLRDFTLKRHFWLDDARFARRSWNVGWLERQALPGDPEGYQAIDLGRASYFEDGFTDFDRLRFHQSARGNLRAWHAPGRHVYWLARCALAADFFVSLAKLKTHKKCGATLAMKNLVGLTHRKEWIPHYRRGGPPGGDEFNTETTWAARRASRWRRVSIPGGHSLVVNVVRREGRAGGVESGNWHGNDVVWRVARDLNIALLQTDAGGQLQPRRTRGYLALIDGLTGGEGEGPLRPVPVASGVLVAGCDPLSVDRAACRLMDFPKGSVPMVEAPLWGSYWLGTNDLAALDIRPAEAADWRIPFRPPSGWLRA